MDVQRRMGEVCGWMETLRRVSVPGRHIWINDPDMRYAHGLVELVFSQHLTFGVFRAQNFKNGYGRMQGDALFWQGGVEDGDVRDKEIRRLDLNTKLGADTNLPFHCMLREPIADRSLPG